MACELKVGSTPGSAKNSSLRTMVMSGLSCRNQAGAGESVTMKMCRTQGAYARTPRSAYRSSSIWR